LTIHRPPTGGRGGPLPVVCWRAAHVRKHAMCFLCIFALLGDPGTFGGPDHIRVCDDTRVGVIVLILYAIINVRD